MFLVLLMINPVSWAKWDITDTDPESKSIDYHDKSIIKNGAIVNMWVLTDYKEEKTDALGVKYRSLKMLLAFDCKSKVSTLVSYYAYSGSMGSGRVVESFFSSRKMRPEFPALENEWKFACEKK